jgi:hypothetical protein
VLLDFTDYIKGVVTDAGAKMQKTPLDYELITYIWVIGLSAWGGLANYFHKIKMGVIVRFSFVEIVGDIVISGLAGVTTFYLCEAAGFPQVVTAAFIGVAGHMGSRVIFLMENMFDSRIKKMLGLADYPNKDEGE